MRLQRQAGRQPMAGDLWALTRRIGNEAPKTARSPLDF
jgi:hypothetical protein